MNRGGYRQTGAGLRLDRMWRRCRRRRRSNVTRCLWRCRRRRFVSGDTGLTVTILRCINGHHQSFELKKIFSKSFDKIFKKIFNFYINKLFAKRKTILISFYGDQMTGAVFRQMIQSERRFKSCADFSLQSFFVGFRRFVRLIFLDFAEKNLFNSWILLRKAKKRTNSVIYGH